MRTKEKHNIEYSTVNFPAIHLGSFTWDLGKTNADLSGRGTPTPSQPVFFLLNVGEQK